MFQSRRFVSSDILKSQQSSFADNDINCDYNTHRIQYRPGRSGDPGTAGLAVVSVDRFADWIQSSATLRQALHLTSGQTTSPSGQSAGKPIPLVNASGEFYLLSESIWSRHGFFKVQMTEYRHTKHFAICAKICETKTMICEDENDCKKKNTEKFLTVKTGVNGATPTFPSVVTRIKWRSTWYAR